MNFLNTSALIAFLCLAPAMAQFADPGDPADPIAPASDDVNEASDVNNITNANEDISDSMPGSVSDDLAPEVNQDTPAPEPLSAAMPAPSAPDGEQNVTLYLRSKSWFQFGRIMHSSDTLKEKFNYNGNWLQSAGSQFTIEADIGDQMQGAMGLGIFQAPSQVGTVKETRSLSVGWERYVTEARLSFFLPDREAPTLRFDIGSFPFMYNHDTKNLGSYLLRGPVYPGFVLSEFEAKNIDTTVSNTLGLHIQNNLGPFRHDLILKSENEVKEFKSNFDFSLAYTAAYNFEGIFEIGAGANFYRILPIDRDLTLLRDNSVFPKKDFRTIKSAYDWDYYYGKIDTVDSAGAVYDTSFTRLSHQGIKLMGRFSFDPKPLIGGGIFGPNDLKIYAEVAVLGVKDYKGIYESIAERIPMMFGINLPAFGWLDFLTLEIEYYKAPFRDDYVRLSEYTSPAPLPNTYNTYQRRPNGTSEYLLYSRNDSLLFSDFDIENMHKDDIKWSLYLQKTVKQHVFLCGQIANDHYRPAIYTAGSPRYESAFTTLKDYYLMFKIGYIL